ncbi:hypothetical protein DFJ74DRAFT_601858 [Hyaloraphidium curvatum]|nr:hypothetical protein DFJ74DRAFT_601858 [Hyaloraphidium curvatum]
MGDAAPASAPPRVVRPQRIERLDERVVNRIAAGEVVQRPSNAVKELLENALDAGATSVQILVKDGGLKMLQITDNGCGINKEDLPLACERFATSKLRKYEDLDSISTYGFRGEALASISHVAHVTITTKTAASSCAWKAAYSDGKIVPSRPGAPAEPKPCAGNDGTQILVEDIFFNMPMRLKAIKNAAEEYNRTVDVVTRYAVHNAGRAGFTCKKVGSSEADVTTLATASRLDTIRTVFGAGVARELLEVSCESDELDFKCTGFVSNPNFNMKKLTFLLFINDRLVDSAALKRAVESVYSTFLPKNTHPFIYLALTISPSKVDVNVHPTKREVQFLNEDSIVGLLMDEIGQKLATGAASRTYSTQILAPTMTAHFQSNDAKSASPGGADRPNRGEASSGRPKLPPNKLVRTDSKTRRIDTFIFHQLNAPESPDGDAMSVGEELAGSRELVHDSVPASPKGHSSSPPVAKPFVAVQLTSIKELRSAVAESMHRGITEVFREHTFVGVVDSRLALLQHQTRLYMVNYREARRVTRRLLFEQLTLKHFSNFGRIILSPPVPIADAVLIALTDEEGDAAVAPDQRAQGIADELTEKRDMLEEYFSITVDDQGSLHSLPLMLKGYGPNLEKLPDFLLQLGSSVNWTEEKPCFAGMAEELGRFYAAEPPARIAPAESADASWDRTRSSPEYGRYLDVVEHVLFPAFKEHLVIPQRWATTGDIVELANLTELYKVFERYVAALHIGHAYSCSLYL